ncbi:MAG: hypothetical protein LBQ03_01055 [Puniceicoccales bacterium]|nr:hypothetical protein [Puniceicoccales bacterium]
MLIFIFLSTVYKIYGNPIFQLKNISEAFSQSHFYLQQKQQSANVRDILLGKKHFPFVQKKVHTETTQALSTTDANGDKISQLQKQNKPREIKILMLLWHGETDAERGFLEALKEMDYHVTPTVFNVDRSLKRLKQILYFEINYEDYDCIYTFGTRISLIVSEHVHNKVPIVFNAVSYPTKAGLVKDDTDRNTASNGRNFSGIGISAPMFVQLKNMQRILKVKHLAVLANPKEENCLDTLSMIEEIAPSFGITFKRFDITKAEEILPILTKIQSAPIPFDGIYVPSGSPFTENSEIIFNFGRTEKIAMVGEKEDMIRDGALMGTVAKYWEGGQLVAKILDMHRRYRISMAHIPIQYPEFYCIINRKIAEELGVHLDPEKINFKWFTARE